MGNIDLDRMARLLNNFNGNEENIAREHFIDFKDYLTSSDDAINICNDDIYDLFSYEGKIVGYSGISNYDKLKEKIVSNIENNNIKKFECAMIVFIYNPEVSFFKINDLMEKTNDSLPSDVELVFGGYLDSKLAIDEIKYFMLISGIKDEEIKIEEEYKKLLSENRYLKKQNKRMQESLLCMKIG